MIDTKTLQLTDRIDKLGNYFVHFNIRERFQLTFEQFVTMVDTGRWEDFIRQEKGLPSQNDSRQRVGLYN